MTTRSVTILNRAGIHARPASLIVQTAQQFDSSIWIEKDDVKINAKSIMNILTLGATYQTKMTVSAEGEDEEDAVNDVAWLFDNKFKEE
ncbi:MAG: HPr family phosphocarrier protein [Spirochaetaceae bacterium]|nr:HPr family phosphocarrier protein [Spirochaetaceae bacterium]RKX74735.1 MAG: phosphocarrier protein HPr [Spirochaetota bacterium]RKX76961.1 MAG: phosphocarrier protein HPr [Spirochaetota bacterium]RKX82439.1 MAG: phosphocarrier protein HPr [Spirochaetota bacterium]RKX98364.1 MAG: phosphocarrier protein HPr [Spirochaetota bacterium]